MGLDTYDIQEAMAKMARKGITLNDLFEHEQWCAAALFGWGLYKDKVRELRKFIIRNSRNNR